MSRFRPARPSPILALPAVCLLALPTLARADADAGTTVRGQVIRVSPDANRLTLRTPGGQEVTLHVGADTRLTFDDRPARLSRFKEGSRVRATYQARGGQNVALALNGSSAGAADVRRQVQDTLRAVKSYTFRQRDEYRKRLEGALERLDDQIDDLKQRSQQAGAEARQKYARQIEELRRVRETARGKLARVKSATADTWDTVKAGVAKAFEDLQDAFDRLRERWKE